MGNGISMKDSDYWIERLGLIEHPEGGYFRETFKSSDVMNMDALPDRYTGDRTASTAIFFLLKSGQVSLFHRLKSDEVWHFYTGSPLILHVLDPDKGYQQKYLGSDLENGQSFQIIIESGKWFGGTVLHENSYTLVGCTVAPGFEFVDFEVGRRPYISL